MPAEQFREAIIDAIIHDKKREGDDVLFALPMAIGRVIIMPIPISILSDFVRRAP
jgi:3-dehydroquinate synthetase